MFSFSDDVLGFGAMTGGAGGTAECGSRPNCVSWLDKDCSKKNEDYNDCVRRAMDLKSAFQQKSASAKSRNHVIIAVAVIIGSIIVISLFKKKK